MPSSTSNQTRTRSTTTSSTSSLSYSRRATTTAKASASSAYVQAFVRLKFSGGLRSLPPDLVSSAMCDTASGGLLGSSLVSGATVNVTLSNYSIYHSWTDTRGGASFSVPPLYVSPCHPVCVDASLKRYLCASGAQAAWPQSPSVLPAPSDSDVTGFTLKISGKFDISNLNSSLQNTFSLGASGFPALAAYLLKNSSVLVNNTSPLGPRSGLTLLLEPPSVSLPSSPSSSATRSPSPSPSNDASKTDSSVGLGVGLFFLFLALIALGLGYCYYVFKKQKAARSVGKPSFGSVVNYEDLSKKAYLPRGGKVPTTVAEILFPNNSTTQHNNGAPLTSQVGVKSNQGPVTPSLVSSYIVAPAAIFGNTVRALVFTQQQTPISSQPTSQSPQSPRFPPPRAANSGPGSIITSNPAAKFA